MWMEVIICECVDYVRIEIKGVIIYRIFFIVYRSLRSVVFTGFFSGFV